LVVLLVGCIRWLYLVVPISKKKIFRQMNQIIFYK